MIRSTLAYAFVALYVVVMTPIAIGLSMLIGGTPIVYSIARFCIRTAGLIAGVRARVKGREHLADGETYLFLSNHQSNCDALLLAHALPRDYRALMKHEVMRLPVMRFIFEHVNFVTINRHDPRDAHAGIERAAELLRLGLSFIAFPEGTRSRTGELGEFKRGVFVLALKSGRPVVPVTIRNSRAIQPPGSYRLRRGIVDVIIHQPIPTAGLDIGRRQELAAQTRTAIESALR